MSKKQTELLLQSIQWFYITNNSIEGDQGWLLTQKVTIMIFTSSTPILTLWLW